MPRRRFTERQVLETLIRTGHEIRCYRTKEVITLESVKRMEREHVTPLALGGADDPTNAAYSLSEAHKVQTFGKKHTSYGSDRHAMAKEDRILGVTGNGPKRNIPSRPLPKPPKGHKHKWPKRTTPHRPMRRDFKPNSKDINA